MNVLYKMLFWGGSHQKYREGVDSRSGVDIITFTELGMVVSGGQTKHLDNS